jgi:HEXXH motif-containing protein
VTRTHRLTEEQFDRLASVEGAPAEVRLLRDARRSRTLLFLRYLCAHWPVEARIRDAAVDVLAAAQERSPDRVADLIGEPHTGAWTARTARRLYTGDGIDPPSWAYLPALAAVAARAAGLDADLPGLADGAGVFLPGLGRLAVPPGPVDLRVRSGAIHVGRTGTDGPGFDALYRLTAAGPTGGVGLALDDLDPFRGAYHAAPAGRLTTDQVAAWQGRLDEAWDLLSRHCPGRAAELAAGLRTLVPLRARDGIAQSSTSLDAYGAMGLTLPSSAAELAVTLVHEFQHSKLGATLDFVRLYDPAHRGTYFAPWRLDPRPAGGLLQGVYAFLAIAATWRDIGEAPELRHTALADTAAEQLAEIREQVAYGLAALETSGALTADGVVFVAGLRRVLDRLQEADVPAEVVVAARDTLARIRREWHLRNGRVPSGITGMPVHAENMVV